MRSVAAGSERDGTPGTGSQSQPLEDEDEDGILFSAGEEEDDDSVSFLSCTGPPRALSDHNIDAFLFVSEKL